MSFWGHNAVDITLVVALSAVVSVLMYYLVGKHNNGGRQMGYYYVKKLEDENATLRDRVRELEQQVISLQKEMAELRREHIRVLRQLSSISNKEGHKRGCDIRVVAVWPDATGLDLKKEQRALFDAGVDVIPVFGAPTRASIVSAVSTSDPDVLQISAHGHGENISGDVGYNPAEIDVAGGVTSGWLIKLLRSSTVRLLVLMSCSSLDIARSVHSDGAVDAVVATTRDVNDNDAIAFVAEFYRMLCKGETVNDAYDKARLVLPVAGYQSITIVGDGNFKLV